MLPGGRDSLYVTTGPLPGEKFDEQQLRLPLGGRCNAVDVGYGEVKRSFDEHRRITQGYLELARKSLEDDDWRNATYSYNALLGALIATVDAGSARPSKFYRNLIGGEDLYLEAVLGAAAYATPKTADTTLDHLGYVRRILKLRRTGAAGEERAAIDGDLARVKLMRAYTIMRYADLIDELEASKDQEIAASLESLAFEREGELAQGLDEGFELGVIGGAGIEARHEFYENAERKIRTALKLTDVDAQRDHAALQYVGKMLLVDVLARQADCSFWRRDPDAYQKEIFDKLESAAHDLSKGYEVLGINGAEVAASHLTNVAFLFKRMHADNRALGVSRVIFDQSSRLATTEYAKTLFASKEFKALVDENRLRVLTDYELRRSSGSRPFLNRLRASPANAHSKGALESFAMNTAGAVVVGGAVSLLGGSPFAVVGSATLGALVARMGMSLWNGWVSEEAIGVGQTGLYHRSGKEQVRDWGRLVGSSMFSAALMIPPIIMGVYVPEWFPMAYKTGSTAADFFTDKLYAASTYKNVSLYPPANTFLSDFLWYFARPLEAATGLYWLTYMFAPQSIRDKQALLSNRSYVWPALLAGGLCLSADLSMILAGKADFFNRIWRGAIGIGAASAMLMMGGIVALRNTGSWREVVSSVFHGFKHLNKMNLVAVSIMTGVSSAIGGHMEKSFDTDNELLRFLHGAFINMTVLPLPIIISGSFKRYYNPIRGAREGWQDAKGEGYARHMYEAAKGFLTAFWVEYPENRAGRAALPWFDWFAAGWRRWIAWDTNMGTLAMSAVNVGTVDSVGTITWKETGNTDWEREAFREILPKGNGGKTKDVAALLYDHWRKAGQRISPFHMFYPHAVRDKLWAFSSIWRIKSSPKFPQFPDPHYFAGTLQQLMGKHKVALSDEAVKQMLEHVRCLSAHPRNYAIMRPVVQTLYAARARDREAKLTEDSEESASPHGLIIRRFFERNPYIIDLLNITRSTLTPPDAKHRSSLKIWALRNIKLSRQEYVKRVREHRALKDRVIAETRARREARRWSKEQVGTGADYESKLRAIEDDLLKDSDQVLRRKEKLLVGTDNGRAGNNIRKQESRRAKRIRRLATTMSRMGGGTRKEKLERRVELENYLRTLSEEGLWEQELSVMEPSRADKVRRESARAIARVLLAHRRHHLQVKKEIELLEKVAKDFSDEKKKRPIYNLFQYNRVSNE